MPLFTYKAKTLEGQNVNGELEASDVHSLYSELRKENIFVLSAKEKEGENRYVVIKSKDLAEFSNQLGTMLSSGIPLTRTLNIIVQRTGKAKLKELYGRVYSLVQQGILLSDAMERQGQAFPFLMINMVRAGEASGQLEVVAMKMSIHYEKETRLQSKIRNAMIYPCIILTLTVAVIMIIFTVVLPKLFKVFKGKELPATTKFLLNFSRCLQSNWYLVILIAAMVVTALIMIARLEPVKYVRHKLRLKLPIVGKIFRTIYTARFARGLSSLYSSGLSMVQSLQICRGLVNNRYIERLFPKAVTDVKNGVPLSNAIVNMDGFDTKLPASIYVGEESGRINEILDKLADSYDYEADQATGRLITLIEPLLIILMAAVVGTVMVSVIMPIYQYYHTIGV